MSRSQNGERYGNAQRRVVMGERFGRSLTTMTSLVPLGQDELS